MEHLEGRQSVLAALRARQRKFQVILVRHGTHADSVEEILQLAIELGVPIRYTDSAELDALAHGATHGGVMAIASSKPRTSIDDLLEMIDRSSAPPLLLLLEGIDDARNLGFVLRTALAIGAHAVLVKKHLWDFNSVEIARPSSGAYEQIPLVQIDNAAPLRTLQQRGIRLVGCLANVKRTVFETDLAGGVILAIGGEKRGLSGAVREICDEFMTIPTHAGAPSLSLSHAAAIVLAEALRQRLLPKPP